MGDSRALPTVLLLHGLGGCRADVLPIARHLEEPCIAPNAIAHGGRPAPAALDFETLARDALAVLDAHGAAAAYILGISMGAATALTMTTLEPDRILGLFLLAPAWWRQEEPPNLRRLQKIGRVFRDKGVEHTWSVVSALPPVCYWEPQEQRSYLQHFRAFDAAAVGRAMIHLPGRLPVCSEAVGASHADRTAIATWIDDPIHPLRVAEQVADHFGGQDVELLARPRARDEEGRLIARLVSDHLERILESSEGCARTIRPRT